MSQGRGTQLRLGNAAFQLEEVVTHSQGSPWAGFDSFEDIWGRASKSRKVPLEFLSPTAFRSSGRRNFVFPQPELVFGSYLSKWNPSSPIKFDECLRERLVEQVIPARYKLETRILDFGSYQEVGFEGRCTFIIADSVPDETVQQINALADFAFYAGTGAKTTMGMGQTRGLPDGGSLSDGTRSHPSQRG
jgi:CRISPR-associated endoribonuclease Cas6